jgi:hypothetical protein
MYSQIIGNLRKRLLKQKKTIFKHIYNDKTLINVNNNNKANNLGSYF